MVRHALHDTQMHINVASYAGITDAASSTGRAGTWVWLLISFLMAVICTVQIVQLMDNFVSAPHYNTNVYYEVGGKLANAL